MAISQGDLTVFLTRPISATILAVALAILIAPPLFEMFKTRWRRQTAAANL
jgi:putative tricarboxylic transport membrane protein